MLRPETAPYTIFLIGSGILDLSARAHWMDFDDFMISLTGGINF